MPVGPVLAGEHHPCCDHAGDNCRDAGGGRVALLHPAGTRHRHTQKPALPVSPVGGACFLPGDLRFLIGESRVDDDDHRLIGALFRRGWHAKYPVEFRGQILPAPFR
jgi:hypothetical protein